MADVFALDAARAMSLLPRVQAVMISAFEHKRSGLVVDRVMCCADDPWSVAVALPKGHRLATLIRDSHAFSLNIVDTRDRLLIRKFDGGSEADAFELMECRTIVTGSPCLCRATACIDCDVMRHFDLEADFEMYVGMVMGVWHPGEPERAPSITTRLPAPYAGVRLGAQRPAGHVNGAKSNGSAGAHELNGHGANGHHAPSRMKRPSPADASSSRM